MEESGVMALLSGIEAILPLLSLLLVLSGLNNALCSHSLLLDAENKSCVFDEEPLRESGDCAEAEDLRKALGPEPMRR